MKGSQILVSFVVSALVALTVALLYAGNAGADNYGGVSTAEFNRSAAAVYVAFAKPYGPAAGHEMVRCMIRESGGNPRAANWSDSHPTSQGTFRGSFGLLQIGALHAQHTLGVAYRLTGGNKLRLWDARINIEAGLRLFASDRRQGGRGFRAWGGGC